MGSHGEVYALRPTGERHTVWGISHGNSPDSSLQAANHTSEEDCFRDAPHAAVELRSSGKSLSHVSGDDQPAGLRPAAMPRSISKSRQVAQTPIGLAPSAPCSPDLCREGSRVASSPNGRAPRSLSTPKRSTATSSEASVFK